MSTPWRRLVGKTVASLEVAGVRESGSGIEKSGNFNAAAAQDMEVQAKDN